MTCVVVKGGRKQTRAVLTILGSFSLGAFLTGNHRDGRGHAATSLDMHWRGEFARAS